MGNRYLVILVPILLLFSGCKTPQPKTPKEESTAEGTAAKGLLAERFVSAVDLDKKFDALLDSKSVSDAGNRLWARLENDPDLGAAGNAYLARTFSRPEFLQAVAGLMFDEAGMELSEEQFNTSFDQRIDTLLDHPRADALWDEIVETPKVEGAIEKWSEAVANTTELAAAVLLFATESHWQEVWRQRMAPTRNEVAMIQWLADYIETEQAAPLVQALGDALIEDPILEQLVVDIVDHPALLRILKGRLLALLQSPEFLEATDRCLLSLLEGRPLEEQLSALKALIYNEATITAMGGIFIDASHDAALNNLISDALVQLVENLRKNKELARKLSVVEV